MKLEHYSLQTDEDDDEPTHEPQGEERYEFPDDRLDIMKDLIDGKLTME